MRIIILILIFVNILALSAVSVGESAEFGNAESLQYETETGGIVFTGTSGAEIGKISIPALSIENEPLYYLPTRENLKKGVCMDGPEGGWQIVGEKGRSMISAHNDKAFRRLDKLKKGDSIFISMEYGDFEFRVSDIFIYRHGLDDWQEAVYENIEEYGLAIVTCYPLNKRNTTGDRLVIRCSLKRWPS